ncbi:MAG TPA: PAS domain-containing protein [Pyrinomonadaceae bacterium]|nr:PAS domain-containing protein [Pyrinomonadaceae bacterium]
MSYSTHPDSFFSAALDSVPANIAILGPDGVIVAVNAAWREFGAANGLTDDCGIGINYIELCREAAPFIVEARPMAAGLRSVLAGKASEFTIEYPCDSPAEKRFFRAIVTPLGGDPKKGAVVSHVNITGQKEAEVAQLGLTADLEERVKELAGLYAVSKLLRNDLTPSKKLFEQIVAVLPGAMKFPAIAAARLSLLGIIAETPGYRPSVHALTAPIRLTDGASGEIEIVYLSSAADEFEGPFLAEERSMLDSVAELIRLTFESSLASKRLRDSNRRYQIQLENLAELSRSGIFDTENELTLKNITEVVSDTLGVERVSIWTYSLDRSSIIANDLFVRSDNSHSSGTELFAADFPNYFKAVASNKLVVAHDAITHPVTAEFAESYLKPNGIASMLDAPIVIEGSVSGVVCLEHTGERRIWTSDEQSFTFSVANLVSLALAERERRKSEAALERAQEIAHLGSWELDFTTDILSWSAETYRIFGLEPDQFGSSFDAFLSVVHPDDRRALSEAQVEALSEKNTIDIEHRIVLPNGSVKWVHELGHLTRDPEGLPLRLTGTVRDITESKIAQDAIKAQQTLLSNAQRIGNMGAWSADPATGFLTWSPEIFKIFGVDPRSFTPTTESVFGMILEEDRSVIANAIKRITPKDHAFRAEYRIRRPDGEIRWMFERGDAEFGPDGKQLRRIGMVMDITDRKLAENAIRESEARFRTVFNNAATGIATTDLSGRFTDANPAYLEMIGYTIDEIRNLTFRDITHRDDLEKNVHDINDLIAERIANVNMDKRYVSKDGSDVWVRISVSLQRDADGRPAGLIGITEDISKQVEAQDALNHTRALAKFATSISRLGAWGVDAERKVTWSEETRLLFEAPEGYMPTVEEGLALYNTGSRDEITQAFEACFARSIPFDIETGVTTFKGNHRWVRVIGEPMCDENGNVVGARGAIQDHSALREAEHSLAASEARFRQLAESMPIIVWTADPTGNLDFANHHFLEYTGIGVLESLQRDWIRHVHPEDTHLAANRWYEAVKDRRPYEVEYRFLRGSDDQYRWFRVQAQPALDASGNIINWYGTAIDINDSKLLERNATALAEQLAATLESIRDGFFTLDHDWKFKYVNSEAEKMLLRSRDDLIGKNIWEEFPEAIGSPAEINYRRTMEEAVTSDFEFFFEPLDTWFGVTSYPSSDGISVYFRDITDIRNHREQMRESDERFRLLAKATNDAIWDWDLTTDELWWNEGFETLFGFRRSEIESTLEAWTRLIHPEDREPVTRALHAAIDSGKDAWSHEYRFARKDGTYAFVLDRGYVIHDVAGVPIRMIGGMTDLSERKELEAKLLQSQKMDAIGQLAGGVAHDFNNLLTVINGYSDLLMRSMVEETPDRKKIAAIRDAGERAANLTRQMLAFGRKQILAPKIVDLNEIVEGMNKLLKRLIGEDIEFQTDLAEALSPIKVDPAQMEQVLLNLAVNARDAMPVGGKLTIRTETVVVGDSRFPAIADLPPGNYAMLTFGDTGVGIDRAIIDRIFEPFFTTKDAGKGTGLGLATVFGIINQSGGHIAVSSEENCGATFTIWLPAVNDAAASDLHSDEAPLGGKETILLVEDEEAVRRIARLTLETYGYNVLEAPEADTAKDLFGKSGQIDMVVSDVIMPGINGRELAEHFRGLRPDIKVLYISGYTDDAVLARGVSESKDAFLQKPFTPQAIARAVRTVLDN